jgi:formate dehydrogenase
MQTWCRLGWCGRALKATIEGERLVELASDSTSPLGKGEVCQVCQGSLGARTDPRRLLTPKVRSEGFFKDCSWDEALKEIAGKLKKIRKQSGPEAIGLYLGASMATDTKGAARALGMALGLGTPNFFSALSTEGGPWLYATEAVIGRPMPLLGDVGRAHCVVLLGANQEAEGFGPLQVGPELLADLAHSRKTKSTKVIAVDPRKTPIAAKADTHIPILPGTELFFMLGLIRAVLDNNWQDEQYVRDYTSGLEELKAAITPWTLARCAKICGVGESDLQGTALRFSRAAMGVCLKSKQSLNSQHGTLTAWAVLVFHALTANLLRPGGLYENKSLIDIKAFSEKLLYSKAPKTRVCKLPLVLAQAPGALLTGSIRTPGEGQLRALIVVGGDPALELPGGAVLKEALQSLDLLVVLDVQAGKTGELAHYQLPMTHPWERAEARVLDNALLGFQHLAKTPALVPAPGEARAADEVLGELFFKLGPGLKRGAFGISLRLLGAKLGYGNLKRWEESLAAFPETPWTGAEVDRAVWRPGFGRFNLVPAELLAGLQRLQEPVGGLRLLLSGARDAALSRFDRGRHDPGVTLHPSLGFAEGARVRIRTQAGSVEAKVTLDAGLRPETVDLPAGYAVDALSLIPVELLDPFTGTPALNGLSCTVEAV